MVAPVGYALADVDDGSNACRNAFETVVCYTKAEIDSATMCGWR